MMSEPKDKLRDPLISAYARRSPRAGTDQIHYEAGQNDATGVAFLLGTLLGAMSGLFAGAAITGALVVIF